MIPYIDIPALEITSSYSIQPFGIMLVTAVWSGVWYARRRARIEGLEDDEFVHSLFWAVGVGFFVCHIVDVLFYTPYKLRTEGIWTLFKVWDGLSSVGGFLGGSLGLFIYWRRRGKSWIKPGEIVLQGFALAWIFGRLGCTIVHDHPGSFTDFFLGVKFPDGVRHDLGLYEFLFTALILFPTVLILHRIKPPTGAYFAALIILYMPVRFVLDFLRVDRGSAADPRFFELTFAQYSCIGLLMVGIYLAVRLKQGMVIGQRGHPKTA